MAVSARGLARDLEGRLELKGSSVQSVRQGGTEAWQRRLPQARKAGMLTVPF